MKYVLVLLILVSGFIAQDIKTEWKFQVRERSVFTNYNDEARMGSLLRTRLGVKLSGEKNVSAFIQLQDSRMFGDNITIPPIAATLGSTNRVDMHQAYITIDKLFDSDFSLTLGRQEVAYANQRIIGAVGWHNVARSFDGATLRFKNDNNFVDVFSHTVANNGLKDDSTSVMLRGLHGHFQVNKDLGVDGFFYNLKTLGVDANLQTFGVFAKGKADKVSYELMIAKQGGATAIDSIDYDGMYIGAQVGYAVSKETSVILGYESLSGNDGTTNKKNEAFVPFAGTNHKFNGFMDYFYVPGGRFFGNTAGLNDIMLRLKHNGLMLDFHMFSAIEDIPNPADLTKNLDSAIGNEIDVTYKHKYSKNLTVVGGLSMFMAGDDFKNSSDKSDLFAYTMFIFNL